METITLSTNDYSSYVTVAFADVYLLPLTTDAATAFKALDAEGKGSALVTATRLLDNLPWNSDYDTQEKREDLVAVQNACCEIAALVSEDAATGTEEVDAIKRLKAGSVEIENFRSERTVPLGAFGTLPLYIRTMLKSYIGGNTVIAGARSYGTSKTSPADPFERFVP